MKDALTDASRELPDREIRARAEDGFGEYSLAACGGQCAEHDAASFNTEGVFPDLLTANDYRAAGVEKLRVGLFWPEGMLAAIQEQTSRLDRSLSWIVQKAWSVAKELPASTAGENGLPRDGDRRRQSIYLPIDAYAELSEVASQEERSMSFVVQRALSGAWPTITALDPQQG